MTTDSPQPAAHDAPHVGAPATGTRPTTLDPGAGYLTVINTYAIAPERAEELLNLLVRATVETLRYVPGFISANFHVNLDRTQVVNYSQWRNREALAAAGADPKVMARIREAGSVATGFTPIQYELRESVAAPGA
ncbi:antibiotic biosynthesis monooxygenase [Gemmatimonadetes bacterium T265]|nr:antibiotic biosynthesis monooxygenase [Gemmatimonadetes bacterium T265]